MTAKSNTPLLYAFDTGNGTCKGISSETRTLVQFAPVIAPLTDKRGIKDDDDKPLYSLKVDDSTLVFGVDDVFTHGKRAAIRRLNAQERYTSADYFRLLDVLYLQCFAAHRGNSQPIAPTGVISLPVGQYNNEQTVNEVKATLVGKRTLIDYEGCELRLVIEPKRLLIVPESYGALMHTTYDPKSLKKRPDADTTGTTLVIDIGYETTDCSLFEGLKYQRDRAFTITRAGMGIVTRAVQEFAKKALRDADASRIDRAMQGIAGMASGSPKHIEPTPGVLIDVAPAYDTEVEALAARIAQEVQTLYPEAVSRVLIAGGGSHHLAGMLAEHLSPMVVQVAPDPDAANVLGAFTMLNIESARR